MALPKIDTPIYELMLPLSKKRIKYRPFTVKEQRNLLMAMESDETEVIQQNVADILNNCCLTENTDIDKLPIIDAEYFFINLRAKSVGEIVDARYRCNNMVEDKMCNNIMETNIDLTKIKVEMGENVSNQIQLNDKFIIKLKYPEFAFVRNALQYEDVNTLTFNIIAQSVEYIYDSEQYYYANEVEQSEMVEFIENLNQEQFNKIEEFFNNLPKMRQKIEMTCKKCQFHHTINVEGLENFFG
jgi:hypothetical protein